MFLELRPQVVIYKVTKVTLSYPDFFLSLAKVFALLSKNKWHHWYWIREIKENEDMVLWWYISSPILQLDNDEASVEVPSLDVSVEQLSLE